MAEQTYTHELNIVHENQGLDSIRAKTNSINNNFRDCKARAIPLQLSSSTSFEYQKKLAIRVKQALFTL